MGLSHSDEISQLFYFLILICFVFISYRRLKVKERSADIISSLHRARTIQSLFPPKTTEDILRILGDTSDSLYPIYRHPTPADPAVTAATGK